MEVNCCPCVGTQQKSVEKSQENIWLYEMKTLPLQLLS